MSRPHQMRQSKDTLTLDKYVPWTLDKYVPGHSKLHSEVKRKKLSCEEIVPAICNVQLLFSYHFHIVSEYIGMNILLQ